MSHSNRWDRLDRQVKAVLLELFGHEPFGCSTWHKPLWRKLGRSKYTGGEVHRAFFRVRDEGFIERFSGKRSGTVWVIPGQEESMEAPDANTITARPLIYVKVRGDKKAMDAYTDFLLSNRLLPIRGYGYADPFTHIGFFLSEDAEKIRQWCRDNNVEEAT